MNYFQSQQYNSQHKIDPARSVSRQAYTFVLNSSKCTKKRKNVQYKSTKKANNGLRINNGLEISS